MLTRFKKLLVQKKKKKLLVQKGLTGNIVVPCFIPPHHQRETLLTIFVLGDYFSISKSFSFPTTF